MPALICFVFVFEVINIYCCGCSFGFSSIPDRRSVISNAGGDGDHRFPTGITPQAHMGLLPARQPPKR